jgi:uncharacterized protein
MSDKNYVRTDVRIAATGVTLAGWYYCPQGPGPFPAIVMSPGFACVKELFVDRFAEAFAEAGFAVLLYDHRNFGASGGDIRGEISPWQQIEDMRDAVTWLCSQPNADPGRIGLWGSSYSGGHVIVLGATDRRLRCVVAQVPTISGYQTFLRRVAPPLVEGVLKTMAEDRALRYAGGKPARRCVIPDGDTPGIYNGADAVSFWGAAAVMAPSWENSVTLRSSELASHYEPGAFIGRVSPTPLLMIVAEKDDVTPADLALAAYNQALEPKKLHLIEGRHFDPYDRKFTEASTAALAWFRMHLIGREVLL